MSRARVTFAADMSGLYFHIPFCRSRCAYCAFHSTTRLPMRGAYADALCREMELYRGFDDADPVRTVYFGGGTPSQMSPELIARILRKADETFGLDRVEEITLECNPDDLGDEYLSGLEATPVNRISMGVQSLDDGTLRTIRRRHTAEGALEAIRKSHMHGFGNISADLIYGLPGQSVNDFVSDIRALAAEGVTHLSAYCLSYEENTPLFTMMKKGEITQASDELCAELYHELCQTMSSLGFIHYEISNFCKPGFHSRHNSCYWDGTRYLGIGSGAHSFDGKVRRWNIPDIDRYISGMISGRPSMESETLTEDDRYNEMVMLSLRTGRGISLGRMSATFGEDAVRKFLSDAGRWIETGDLIHDGDYVRFSESGLFTGDGIVSRLFRG